MDENTHIIEGITPNLSSQVTLKVGTLNVETSLYGVNEIYETVKKLEISSGKFISTNDVDKRRKVVVIGSYINNALFENENAIGQNVKINGVLYSVVGVLKEKSSSEEESEDDRILIPYTAAERLLKNSKINNFIIQSKNKDTIEDAETALEIFLGEKLGEDGYRIFNQEEMLDTVNETTGMLKLLLGSIAGISLVVGGIGIMNIMLVSVTERTKEIGVRKAIGAKRKDILVQFLIESIFISCLGGVVGILLGILASFGVGKLVEIVPIISLNIVVLSVSFSVIIGVFFGLYPANKASKLNPIDALRYE